MTLRDLIQSLRGLDEVTLLELLNITSEELVDAFMDKVEERESFIRRQLENVFQ